MAMATVTIPAFAAAGIYLFDKSHPSKVQELKGAAPPLSIGGVLNKAKKDGNNVQMPKWVPKFDGLKCFETLVGG